MARLQNNRRKPLSFNTTMRNPERIPQFISILQPYEGEIANNEVILKILSDVIRFKLYVPTKLTLGTYINHHKGKFEFWAEDSSAAAPERVNKYFEMWKNSTLDEILQGKVVEQKYILYLLKNTVTDHNEGPWGGGWSSRFYTYYQFIIELGLVFIEFNKPIKISPLGNLMCKYYENGYKSDDSIIDVEQRAYLNVFAKYQTNNPHRSNTISVNFLPLLINTLNYLKSHLGFNNGLCRSEIPFLICWGNNDYKTLSLYIKKFREKFGYNPSDEVIYAYAMGLMESEGHEFREATDAYIKEKKQDYKFDKLLVETPDEIIRKIRYSGILSLRGNGRFIDLNALELEGINYIINNYGENKSFSDSETYFNFMGACDENLLQILNNEVIEDDDIKLKAICEYSQSFEWNKLKEEVTYCISKRDGSKHPVLKYVNKPVRLEFLVSVSLYKALPNIKLQANYKVDDEGIPIGTASGQNKTTIGADIDVYEDTIHALIEPTIATSRSFLTEHEIGSITTHLLDSADYDVRNKNGYKQWFALLITPEHAPAEVSTRIKCAKMINDVDIFLWEAPDFVEYIQKIKKLEELAIIRPYVKIRKMPKVNGHGLTLYPQVLTTERVADKQTDL